MKRKNMKIEINDEQPLDEVVKELERLGYRYDNEFIENKDNILCVATGRAYMNSKVFSVTCDSYKASICEATTTTLQQLREME